MDVIIAIGSARGLALLWQDSIDLCVLNRDKWFFHCMTKSTFGDWFVSFIQGPHIN